MTFSAFVRMLYTRIGGRQSADSFLVSLVTEIIDDSLADKEHPFYNKQPDTLERIFTGRRELSRADARVILVNIKRERFIKYLSDFSEDVLALLGNDMENYGLMVSGSDVAIACTNLFVQVLENCATGVDMSIDKKQSLLEQIDLFNQNKVFNQAFTLLKRAEKNKLVADQLREIFVRDGRGYQVEDFIRDYIGDRIELSSSPNFDENSTNDIQGWFQTVYESCLEMEEYDDTTELFDKLNNYIEKSVYKVSSCTLDNLAELSKEIVDMLIELNVAEDE